MSASGVHSQKRSTIKKPQDQKRIDEYRIYISKINDMRKQNDFSSNSLALTTTILQLNPEYYSMWNYRREILSHRPELLIFKQELELVDQLLHIAPKSYWVWNHRRWLLEQSKEPVWEKELKIINYMLDLDSRNFHGWDYRRYVVEQSNPDSLQSEFDYSTIKIHQNFSNYSAWHYRSKLLPKVFEDDISKQHQVEKDIEMIRNAIFTEPSDQSPWLYQRFLLGNDSSGVQLLNAFIFPFENMNKLVLYFNQPVKCINKPLIKYQGDISFLNLWSNSSIQILQIQRLETESTLKLAANSFGGKKLNSHCNDIDIVIPTTFEKIIEVPFTQPIRNEETKFSKQRKEIWENELNHLMDLYELESDCKWVLLALVQFYVELKKPIEESLKLLDHLIKIDSFRKYFYLDTKSKIIVNEKLDNHERFPLVFNASNMQISVLPQLGRFILCKQIDLSLNVLRNSSFVKYFLSVQELNLDGNELENLYGFQDLKHLKSLSVRNNQLKVTSFSTIKLLDLKHLKISGNLLNYDEEASVLRWYNN